MGILQYKKRCYYAPINSTKQGDQVDVNNTTPYTAMQLKLTPLEMAFVWSMFHKLMIMWDGHAKMVQLMKDGYISSVMKLSV